MKKHLFLKALTAAVAVLLPLVVAFAHPHVWVMTSLKVLTQEDTITGIQVNWIFDELFSASFLNQADTNKNKKLDPKEAAHTITEVFIQGEQDLHPFMHMVSAGEKVPFTLKNPKIWMENDELRYQFNIVFTTPQPLNAEHHFGIYDPEFYVAFEQDLDLILPKNTSCQQNLAENPSISIYYGLVNPETYTLNCT